MNNAIVSNGERSTIRTRPSVACGAAHRVPTCNNAANLQVRNPSVNFRIDADAHLKCPSNSHLIFDIRTVVQMVRGAVLLGWHQDVRPGERAEAAQELVPDEQSARARALPDAEARAAQGGARLLRRPDGRHAHVPRARCAHARAGLSHNRSLFLILCIGHLSKSLS